MNKKSGQAGSIVAPIAPIDPHEADKANPGEVEEVKAEQRQTQTGKYGSVKATPFKPSTLSESKQTGATGAPGSTGQNGSSDEQQAEKKLSWIEIELVGEDNKPIPGESYRITLPDGSVAEGTLDHQGFARVEGFEKGDCKITFPNLDQAAWEDV